MAKLTLSDIDNESVPSASVTVNANSALIEAAIENTLSRDGTAPNQMEANLDMNSNRIINHPAARGSSYTTDLIRVGDLAALVAVLGVQGPAGPTGDGTGDMLGSNNLSDVASVVTSQQNLDLEPNVDVLAFNQTLKDIADLSWTANRLLWKNGSNVVSSLGVTDVSVNLLGAANQADARTTIGLGNSATLNVGTTAGTVAAGDDNRFNRLTINTVNSSSNFSAAQAGTMVRHSSASAHTFTIQPNSSVSIPLGSVIQVRNAAAGGNVTLARGSGVALYLAGSATNGNRTLGAGGLCTLIHEDTDVWVVSGAGIS